MYFPWLLTLTNTNGFGIIPRNKNSWCGYIRSACSANIASMQLFKNWHLLSLMSLLKKLLFALLTREMENTGRKSRLSITMRAKSCCRRQLQIAQRRSSCHIVLHYTLFTPLDSGVIIFINMSVIFTCFYKSINVTPTLSSGSHPY